MAPPIRPGQTATATTPADVVIDADEIEAQREFDAGATEPSRAPQPRPAEVIADAADGTVRPEPKPAPAPAARPAPRPAAAPLGTDVIQLTRDQFAALDAAAKKTPALEGQLSKALGTLGNLQQVVRTLQSQTPRGADINIPKDAFAGMARDFPELAEHMRAGLEATLKGIVGTGSASAEVDPAALKALVKESTDGALATAVVEHQIKLEREALDDAFPDWKTIVGAVDIRKGEVADPKNPFRRWLATKDAGYQARLNATDSAAVVTRAIRLFKAETKAPAALPARGAPAAPTPKQQRRATVISAAVRPRGDGGPPGRVTNDDDEFEAGFTG